MQGIAFDILRVNQDITEPEFTENALILPVSYFDAFIVFHNAVINELETLNYNEFMHQCYVNEIAPKCGFSDWIGELTLILWMACLKAGFQSTQFWPGAVAKQIITVSHSTFTEILLKRSDNKTVN